MQGRISASQILCEVFVRYFCGAVKDSHWYTLGSAFAHLPEDSVNDTLFPVEGAEVHPGGCMHNSHHPGSARKL